MRELNVAGATLVTGTQFVAAVVELSAELSRADRTEIVTIPYSDDSGRTRRASLMIGRGEPVWMSSVEGDVAHDEPDGIDILLALRSRTGVVRDLRRTLAGG